MALALIFDLDGTLWDSSEQVAAAWNEVIREYSKDAPLLTRDDVLAQMGLVMEDIGRNITPKGLPKEKQSQFIHDAFRREIDYLAVKPGKLFDGEIEVLEALKKQGLRLFIVSNCQSGYIETYLSAVPPLFEGHLCYDDTKKPKSFTIRELMRRHNVEEAVYIGDTATDEQACLEAGIPFIHASYGFGKAVAPLEVIQNFKDLETVARKLVCDREVLH